MNALNQIILEGNVVRKPEKQQCRNGAMFCNVPIAVNRSYKGSDGNYVNEVSFFDIATFGPMADLCEKWCPKGRGIRVVGRLKQNIFKTEDGKKRSRIEIIAEHIEFKPFLKKDTDSSTESKAPECSQKTDATEDSPESEISEKYSEDEIEF